MASKSTTSTTSVSECRIFYSWQSDTDSRSYTISALKDAVDVLNKRAVKSYNYVADQGCDGDGGALNIATRMLEKIDSCDLYIADLTIVHSAKTDELIHGRRAPNPNVMFELGYAVKKLGWEKVIMIFNESYGEIGLLPFDIKQHRIIPFKHEPNQVTETKNKLNKLMKAHTNVINVEQAATLVKAQAAMEDIENVIKNQPGTKNAKNELVKDLTNAIKAMETENIGMSNKVIGEVVEATVRLSTRVDEVAAAQKYHEKGISIYNDACSIDKNNFPTPTVFLQGFGEAEEWKNWVTNNKTAIMEGWDKPAGKAARSILDNLSGTRGVVVKPSKFITYEGIIELVRKKYFRSNAVIYH